MDRLDVTWYSDPDDNIESIELVSPNGSESRYAIKLMSSDEDMPVHRFDDDEQVFSNPDYLPITFQEQESAERIAIYLRSYRDRVLTDIIFRIEKAMGNRK